MTTNGHDRNQKPQLNPDPVPVRPTESLTIHYLMDRIHLLEGYTASMFQMITLHHPYLGHAVNEIAADYQKRHELLEAAHPVSRIVMPPSGIATPN